MSKQHCIAVVVTQLVFACSEALGKYEAPAIAALCYSVQ